MLPYLSCSFPVAVPTPNQNLVSSLMTDASRNFVVQKLFDNVSSARREALASFLPGGARGSASTPDVRVPCGAGDAGVRLHGHARRYRAKKTPSRQYTPGIKNT